MTEALTAPNINLVTATRPRFEVFEGGGETTPPIRALALASMSSDEWLLADVDDLARFRTADGESYEPKAVASVKQNIVTAVKEGAMPDAVSEVDHEWEASPEGRGGIIRDLGRTAIQTAMRGRDLFYHYDASRARGDVEVDYAAYNQAELRPGFAHMIIEPKMSPYDAPLEVAKAEGLAETDSIQVNWLGLDESGETTVAKTTSILVADVPLQAWVDMLADANNIFGKSIKVTNPESALSVMQTFSELDLPLYRLEEGPVTLFASVLQYIQDAEAKQKATEQLERFRGDQKEIHRLAISPAERWLQFNIETDQSLHHGIVTSELHAFINSLETNWGDEDRSIIDQHKDRTGDSITYKMSRELAKVLQKAVRNLILTSAAVAVGNQKVLDQMSGPVARHIYESEKALSLAHSTGSHIGFIATANNSLIASLNTKVGGGCCPTVQAKFRTLGNVDELVSMERLEAPNPETDVTKSWHGGMIKEGVCRNCSEHTEVGVKNWCKPCFKNPYSRKKAA